jgi:predicted TIM-barrel fold metal-dependent hydrolase
MIPERDPLIDFHTHLWWWPDHLTDEFVDEGMAAKRVKMANSPDVFFSSGDRHGFDATPEMHRRDTAAADLTVVLGFSAKHLGVVVPNELIADYVASDSSRFVGFAGLEPTEPTAVEELRDAYHELGLRGIKLGPIYQNFDPSDPGLADFYREAERLGMPILFHQGTTFPRRAPLKWANPILLEDVALAFPKLRMIVAHLGHPWEAEAVVLIRKQPNVFADISALHYRPWRYWQALITAKEYGVLSKLLPGSDYPSATITQVIEGLRKVNEIVEGTRLPRVPEDAIESIIGSNWRAFLREREWIR